MIRGEDAEDSGDEREREREEGDVAGGAKITVRAGVDIGRTCEQTTRHRIRKKEFIKEHIVGINKFTRWC